ncbi:MAG: DUF445 family protein [Pseudohongiellaceae bacterium]
MTIDKSLLTNVIALLLVIVGLIGSWPGQHLVLNTGLFALSGAVTNWLAVHMLFERVPLFYGSGVIQLRFEEFKTGIRQLVMEQFFSRDSFDRFFRNATEISDRLEQELEGTVEKLDMDSVFDSLLDVVMESNVGGMLGMIGGRSTLEKMREPFASKLRNYMKALFAKPGFREQLQEAVRNSVESDSVLGKLEAMIDDRLDRMTPKMVKEIIQSMIRKHLGWLVVWGGVLGGLIGLLVAILGPAGL